MQETGKYNPYSVKKKKVKKKEVHRNCSEWAQVWGYRQKLQSSYYKYFQRIKGNYVQIMKGKCDDDDLIHRKYK